MKFVTAVCATCQIRGRTRNLHLRTFFGRLQDVIETSELETEGGNNCKAVNTEDLKEDGYGSGCTNPGRLNFVLWRPTMSAVSMELASCHPFGDYDFAMVSGFLKNLCNPELQQLDCMIQGLYRR